MTTSLLKSPGLFSVFWPISVVWVVSTRPVISKSSSPFTNPLVSYCFHSPVFFLLYFLSYIDSFLFYFLLSFYSYFFLIFYQLSSLLLLLLSGYFQSFFSFFVVFCFDFIFVFVFISSSFLPSSQKSSLFDITFKCYFQIDEIFFRKFQLVVLIFQRCHVFSKEFFSLNTIISP